MPKANEVKNVKKTAVADVKVEKVAEVKVEETKAVKAADTKTEVKAAEEKAPAVKKTAEEKAPAAKKTTAKTAEKKTTTKKATAAKKVAESVCVQFGGNEYDVAAIVEKAKAAYTGDAKKMKDIKVYVKPEEGMAYYVVNGDETGSVAL